MQMEPKSCGWHAVSMFHATLLTVVCLREDIKERSETGQGPTAGVACLNRELTVVVGHPLLI